MMLLLKVHRLEKINLYVSNTVYPTISGTVFLLFCIFLLAASIEPARALDNNMSMMDNIAVGPINEGSNIELKDGNIFNIIDEFVDDHAADVQIRIFSNMIAKDTGNSEFVAQEIERLKNEKSHINNSLAILNNCINGGLIPIEACNAALMKIERGKKNIDKQAIEMAGILRPINEKLSDHLVEISIEEDGSSKGTNAGNKANNPGNANTGNNANKPGNANAGNNSNNPGNTNAGNNAINPESTNIRNRK